MSLVGGILAMQAASLVGGTSPALPGDCYAARRVIERGAAICRADIKATPCGENASRTAVGFDRSSRLALARADIRPGEYLGFIPKVSIAAFDAGDQVTVLSARGAVAVERTGTVVQPVHASDPALVHFGANEVLVVHLVTPDEGGDSNG